MYLTAKAQTRLLIDQTQKIGAVLPKPIAVAHQRVSRSADAMSRLRVEENPQALGEAVAAALAAGKDPAADAEVQRVLAARALVAIDAPAQLEAALEEEFRATCREHADAFVKALRKPFDVAAVALADAAAVIGGHPLEDSSGILALGGDAGRAWADAKEAVETISAATAVWSTLFAFTQPGGANPHHRALRIAGLDFDTWERLGLGVEGSKQDGWTLARAGVPLSLPTFTEYRERVQTIAAGHARLAAAAEARNTALMMGRSA